MYISMFFASIIIIRVVTQCQLSLSGYSVFWFLKIDSNQIIDKNVQYPCIYIYMWIFNSTNVDLTLCPAELKFISIFFFCLQKASEGPCDLCDQSFSIPSISLETVFLDQNLTYRTVEIL
jgi:hypothetical protein